MYLTASQYHHVERALSEGYLSDFEKSFQAGELEDYSLFPGGRLKAGKGNPNYVVKHANRTWVRDRFKQLEKLAGVTHVDGRGWHGVRRKTADLAEDFTKDARVLRKEGSWTNDRTRRGYQEEDRPEILRQAAEVRDQIRASPNGAGHSNDSAGDSAIEGLDELVDLIRRKTSEGQDPAELLGDAMRALEEGSE